MLRASSNYQLDQFAEFEAEADADGSEEEALQCDIQAMSKLKIASRESQLLIYRILSLR